MNIVGFRQFNVTYSRCLEDFAKAGEIVDARVQGTDGVVEKLQRGLQRGY